MIGSPRVPGLCQERNAVSPATQNPVLAHSDSHFGSELRTLPSGMGRILLQNPNGLGMSQSSMKQDRLRSSIMKHDFGIIGLSEVGVNWNKIPHRDNWWSRTNSWFRGIRSSKSYNTTDPTIGRAQAGGTITMVRDRFAFCTDHRSFDPRNLGRWSSIRLQGKGRIKTRVVTVYCPCRSNIETENSTYNQQLRTLAISNVHICPRQIFWTDLLAELESWKNAGEQIILMGDWNHPIEIVKEKLQDLGLAEAINTLHPDVTAPATHNRGSVPIDGIFISASLIPVAGGYCMFNKILLSDHRALWIDIPLVYLLGFEMPNIVQPSARKLKINDPRVLAKYKAYLKPYLLKHNIYNRTAAVLAHATYPLPFDVAQEYEAIHLICKEGAILAEQQCRHIFTGVHPWSAAFSKAQDLVVYWTVMCQKMTGKRVDTRKLLRLRNRLKLPFIVDLSISEAYIEKDKAWERYQAAKRSSLHLRLDFLDSLATALSEVSDTPKETILRNLRRREDQRRAAQAVRKVTHTFKAGGTSRVLTTSPNGDVIEITEKRPMEKVIASTHEKKYHSSEHCPLLNGQLFKDIGILGFGPETENILEGTYVCPPDTPRGAKLFLQHMKRPHLPTPLPTNTMQTFKQRWKRTREKTSSAGPLHFGHYKAGCTDDMLGWLYYMLAEVPFISGYSPRDWKNGIDVVILKSINDYRIEKMRTIVLYHPEFNMNNKRLGWEAMNVAIANNQLATEQYSRPGRSAIDHVVNRQLSFNSCVYNRTPFGIASCDLTGCYDRVVHSSISLAMQRLGFSPGAIKSQFETIQTLIHKIRTVFGDSDISYGGNTWKEFYALPPQGFGQGNCFGPPGWSILSSTIFAILKKEGYGVHFIHAISKAAFELCGFAYVDDADLIQVGKSPLEVSQRLQEALSLWEDVIQATGGAMAPQKSWWYSIDIVWTKGQFILENGGAFGDLVAHDTDGKEISLQYLLCHQATKMLGVWLAPDGNHDRQLEEMKKKAQKWADFIRAGHLSPSDSWIAMSTTIWKTLEYPLAALMLTEKEINSVVWPILEITLPKMGITRNVPKVVRYGPTHAGGIGVRNLYLVMGFARLQYLLEHPWKKTPTGNLITLNWESLTLEAGLFNSLFAQDYSVFSRWLLTPRTWVRATLQFLHEKKLTLDHSPFITLSSKRLRDLSIMDGLSRVISAEAELKRLNQCRIFLRVVSLADISSADGTSITSALMGTSRVAPYRSFRRNSFNWPNQALPPKIDWTLWRASLKAAFCAKNWELRNRLGEWTLSQDEYFDDWDYFINTNTFELFSFNGHRWVTFRRCSDRSHSRSLEFFIRKSSCLKPPHEFLRRTTIIATRNASFTVEYFPRPEPIITPWVEPSLPPDDLRTRIEFFMKECKEFSWIAQTYEISDSIDILVQDWAAGTILCISDGSYNPNDKAGAAAWTIESLDGSQFIRGGGRTAGLATSQGAYRSELAGLLGISMVIWAIEKATALPNRPEILVGCDGITALRKSVQSNRDRLHSRDKHFDMIAAIIGFWSNMHSVPFPTHVKGHQDDAVHYDSLDRLSQMNIRMDTLAKYILKRSLLLGEQHPEPNYSFGLPSISWRGIRVESTFTKTAVDLLSEHDAKDYWVAKWKIPTPLQLELDWISFGKAFKMLTFARQGFVRKWLSDTLPVGVIMRKRKHGVSNRCPRCGCYEETTLHCLICKAPAAKTHRENVLSAAFDSLADLDTCPQLLLTLETVLRSWLRSPTRFLLDTTPFSPPFAEYVATQHAIGWHQFFCGFHPTSFLTIQADYLTTTQSSKSPILWASKVTRIFWNVLHEMWEHRNQSKYELNDLPPDSPEITALHSACLAEVRQGTDMLPQLYHRFLSVTPAGLLEMSNADLKSWFKSIRTFRESTHTSITDIFSSNGPFRAWVGLHKLPVPTHAPPARDGTGA